LGPLGDEKSNHRKKARNKPTNYAVAISDFVPMAKLVGECKSAMPSSIAKILERVIDLRESFAELVQQKSAVPAEPATAENHSHFVNVLKQVRQILGGANQSDASPGSSTPPSSRQLSESSTHGQLW